MMIRVDKHFVEELQKNGFDLDFKKVTDIYKESRKHPEVVKKHKKKFLEKGKCYKWVVEKLDWVEISKEEYASLRETELRSMNK